MTNNENKYNPKKIVEDGVEFSIPLYQRLFSWKEDNVKKLLYDLKEHFEKSQNDSKISPYYLGMLTCIEQKEKKFLLIDGQQRMTVMLLMAIVFAKKHKEYDGWENFLMGGNRIEFTARSEDKEYIGWKINPRNVKRNGYTNHNMEQALNVIDSFLEKEFKDNMVDRDKFIENVYHHLTFFISELPQNYKDDTTLLNKYFEAMNSQGRNLEQHEILKVNLLKGMSEQGTLTQIWNLVSQLEKPIVIHKEPLSEEGYRKEYENNISSLKHNFNNPETNLKTIQSVLSSCGEDVTIQDYDDSMIGIIRPKKIEKFDNMSRDDGSYSIITFEEFLLMVLYITEGRSACSYSDYQTDKLLEKFENLQKSDVTKRQQFYYNLLYYRLLLDYYVIRREFINGESNYSLLIRENENDTLTKDSYSAKLQQFQSMLYVSTEFYKWLTPYLVELAKGRVQNSKDILAWLKKQDDTRHAEDIDKLSLSYPSVNRYWFWRLDYYLWEQREDLFKEHKEYEKYKQAVNEYVFRINRSIEHFHPQDESHNTTWEESVVNSFGNLAMISQSFNSQQSNDHLQLKFDRILEQLEKKSLQSIKLLKMCMDARFVYNEWTKDSVEKHEGEMRNLLKESYKANQGQYKNIE